MNLNDNLVSTRFENAPITVYFFHGKPCIIAQDLGELLGYGTKGRGLTELILDDSKWGTEFHEGVDVMTLTGEVLREFKEVARRGLGPRRGHVNKLTILTESGMDLVCVKTDKPLGQKLRRFLVDEVFPRLRRSAAPFGATSSPRVTPLPPPPPPPQGIISYADREKLNMLLDLSNRFTGISGGSGYAIIVLCHAAELVDPALGPKFTAMEKAIEERITYRSGGVELSMKMKAVPEDSVVGPADSKVVPKDSTTLNGPAAVLPLLSEEQRGVSMTELMKTAIPESNYSVESVGRPLAAKLRIIGDTKYGFWSLMVGDTGKRVFNWRWRKPGIELLTQHLVAYRDARTELKEHSVILGGIEAVGDSGLVYLSWGANKDHGLVTTDEPPTYESPAAPVSEATSEKNGSTPTTS